MCQSTILCPAHWSFKNKKDNFLQSFPDSELNAHQASLSKQPNEKGKMGCKSGGRVIKYVGKCYYLRIIKYQ